MYIKTAQLVREQRDRTWARLIMATGFLSLALASGAQTVSFTNAVSITIDDQGDPPTTAAPYPSDIEVSGLGGLFVEKVTVTLEGLTHDFPSDLDVLLVGPQGQMSMLMSEVGGNDQFPVSDVTLTLDNDAQFSLPTETMLLSGTFKPTRQFPTLEFEFPSPAPVGSSSAPADLSVFNGTDPNGTWSLYVVDESSPHSGVFLGGWSLQLTTVAVPEPSAASMLLLGLGAFKIFRSRTRAGNGRKQI